jgi:hypothetical protein
VCHPDSAGHAQRSAEPRRSRSPTQSVGPRVAETDPLPPPDTGVGEVANVVTGDPRPSEPHAPSAYSKVSTT